MRFLRLCLWLAVCALSFANAARDANAQSYGVELHNTLMPASGGMGGTSISRPQDLLSAINGNPATMSQFPGTQTSFSGAWAEPNIRFRQTAALPLANVAPYDATSNTPGVVAGNIGVTQNFEQWGRPVTLGIGLTSTAGGGVDFRGIPASNGTSSELLILQFVTGGSLQLTDQLSVGATLGVGEAFYDAPFSGIGAMVPAYGARGTIGMNYNCTETSSFGLYWQSREHFKFSDAIRFSAPNLGLSRVYDVDMDLPDNVGLGYANRSFMDGNLLLAVDVIYKQWDNCDLYRNVYRNQWVCQTGAQYTAGRYKYRVGYAYAQNPLTTLGSGTVDGITEPDGLAGAYYLQAQLGVICQNRLSAGIGVSNVLPGVDFDMFAGGMFRETDQLGTGTNIAVSSYYVGAGITWKFGACSGSRSPKVN